MSQKDPSPGGRPEEPDGGPRRSPDRTPLSWLLLVPLLATLYPPLYNRRDPELLGIPFFYWYQLVAVLLGVVCTYLVFRATAGGRR